MIPSYLHLFHDGPNPLPDMAFGTIQWADKNGYEAKVWSAKHLPDFEQKQWLIDHKQWSCLSDVCRHWAVYTFGGFYLDTDCEIVGDLGFLSVYKWFATEEPPMYVNCAFSGGELRNHVSRHMLDVITAFDFKGYEGRVPLPAWVGPHLQTQVFNQIRKYGDTDGCAIINLSLGFGLTYQQYHRGVRDWPANGIVRHHWAKSW